MMFSWSSVRGCVARLPVRLAGEGHSGGDGTNCATTQEAPMGLLKGLMKAGVAKKLLDEARKPHNQQKARELFEKARQSRKSGRPRS